jgi:glycosyltransferase involved in cell wall biosynthesis
MRIVIDMQGAQTESRFRGIGRSALSLTLALVRNAGTHDIWLVLNAAFPDSIFSIRKAFADLLPESRLRVFDIPTPVAEREPANVWRARAGEKIREHFLQQLQPDFVLIPSLFEGYVDDAVSSIGLFAPNIKTAVVLHDLIPLMKPNVYLAQPQQRHYYDGKIQSLKKADLLFSISAHSKQEAVQALGLQEQSIITIASAADGCFRPESYGHETVSALFLRLGISRKVVMYAPGGFDPRKNFVNLFAAYAGLPQNLRDTHQLVIVSKITDGDRQNLQALRKKSGLAEHEVVVTGYVSDAELILLYNRATLFVFPSRHEGFGLPVLEAMSCGTPTIGSDTTSIPEVIGFQEALFDPDSVVSISAKITQALTDDAFRHQLSQHGLQQAAKFSWDSCALKIWAAFEGYPKRQGSDLAAEVSGSFNNVLDAIAHISCPCEYSEADLRQVAKAIAFNTAAGLPRQLLYDISELVQRDAKSGIQRVVRSILLELFAIDFDGLVVRPIYFDGQQYRYAERFSARFLGKPEADIVDGVAEFNQGDTYLAVDLNAHLTPFLHPLHARLQAQGVYVYFVVHDILLLQRPDWWPEGTSAVFAKWLASITEVATGLICVSETVANQVRAWVNANPPPRLMPLPISFFHLGADVENSVPTLGLPDDADTVLSALSQAPSFLSVGTIEPRKGHAQTLAAFELLWSEGVNVNLVIVGKQGWMMESLVSRLKSHKLLNKRLFWLQGISDEYLEKVYGASTCLLAASEGEGFGLPLIEAANQRLPIIARDIPIFREVAGEYAYFFNGLQPEMLADAIHQWLGLYAAEAAPKSDNMPWQKWRQSTRQLLAAMQISERV